MSNIMELPTTILGAINAIQNTLPQHYSSLLAILSTALLISIYAIILWKFHKFITKKNILSLNLSKYNYSNHPILSKIFALVLFVLEYIIILPFIIFVWFAAFGTVILLLSGNRSLDSILILAAATISAIRILAYYKEELSQDVAKLMPLTLLVIFISNPDFSSLSHIAENIIQLPKFFVQITYYFILIASLELILRLLSLFSSSE